MPASVAIFASHVEHLAGPRAERMVELARIIEAAGADQIVFSEHVVLADEVEAHGPGGLPFPFPSDHNYPEPMVLMAAVAGATTRLRLATGILIAPLRPAVVLAKMAATLDVISAGRLDLGLGAGWHAAELACVGLEPAQAMAALDDTIGACRALWGEGPASFSSPTVEFRGLHCVPKPSAGSALPIWLAGPCTRSSFRRIVRLGNGWLPFGNLTADDIARGSALLDAAAAEAGRPRDAYGIRAGAPAAGATAVERLDSALRGVPALLAAGATAVQFPLSRLADDLDSVHDVVSTIVREVRAAS